MEPNKQKNNLIDDLFHSKLSNYELEQSNANWHLLQHLQKQNKKKKFFIRLFSLSSVFFIVSSITVYYLFFNQKSNLHQVKYHVLSQKQIQQKNNHISSISTKNDNTDKNLELEINNYRALHINPIQTNAKKIISDALPITEKLDTSNEFNTADVFIQRDNDNSLTTETEQNNYLESSSSVFYVKHGNDSIKVEMQNIGKKINSPFADYAPVINADGTVMYFTSRRPVTEKEKQKNKEGKENIYYSSFDTKRKIWKEAQLMPEPINQSGRFNSIIALSNDGQRMLLYRDDNYGNGDIYESVLNGAQWSEPKKLPEPVNSKYHESSASISPDGRTIFFVSNRPGGVGKLDIWCATKDANGNWSEAKNLGEPVNTEGDEEGVFIHPDGKTLYFSSRGHKGLGGYDIFYSINENGNWSKPVNLGNSINTQGDDVYFVMEANGKVAYYSSQRKDAVGEKDIYKVTFIYPEKSKEKGPLLTLFKGLVLDKETQKPLEAEIEIVDIEKNQQLSLLKSNAGSGQFLISLPSGKNYGINVKREGYLFYSENMNIPATADYNEIIKTVLLDKLKVGSKVILNNIFYDYDKATLRPESMSELDRLYELLNKNPNLKVELSAHTDSRGSDAYNNKLSQERAQSCVDYLIQKGIDKSRIIAKGYGKQQLLISDEELQQLKTEKEKESAHQQNRRTEIKILENNQ